MSTHTKHELAVALRVTVRSVERWVSQGCPAERDADGTLRFDLDAVRAWTGSQGREEPAAPLAPSAAVEPPRPVSTRDAAQRADAARKIAQARRHEHELQQEKGLRELGLDEKVRAAKTSGDLADLAREIGAYVAAGALAPGRGQALRQLLTETRHALRERERAAAQGDDTRLAVVTEPARKVALAFDRLVNGWRRRWIEEALAQQLEADALEFSEDRVDEMPAWLSTLGLDLEGEPVGSRPEGFAAPVVPAPRPRPLLSAGGGP